MYLLLQDSKLMLYVLRLQQGSKHCWNLRSSGSDRHIDKNSVSRDDIFWRTIKQVRGQKVLSLYQPERLGKVLRTKSDWTGLFSFHPLPQESAAPLSQQIMEEQNRKERLGLKLGSANQQSPVPNRSRRAGYHCSLTGQCLCSGD